MPSTREGFTPAGGRLGGMTSSERWKALARGIVYSPYFHLYYAGMIGINMFALGFSFHSPEQAPLLGWFIALEAGITAGLVAEVGLRLVADGRRLFFHSWSNLADVVVLVLCITAFAALVCTPALSDTLEEEFALLIRATRDAIRMLRLLFLCKNSRHSHSMQHIQPVTLRMAAADETEQSESSEREALVGLDGGLPPRSSAAAAPFSPRSSSSSSSFAFAFQSPPAGRRQVAINELQDITSGAYAGLALGGSGGLSGASLWAAETPPQTPTVQFALPAHQPHSSPLLAPLSPRW